MRYCSPRNAFAVNRFMIQIWLGFAGNAREASKNESLLKDVK